MKILLIAYHFDEYMLELSNAMMEIDSNILLFLVTNETIPKDYKHIKIISRKKPRIRNYKKNISILKDMKEVIDEFEPEIIHFQGCTFWFCFILRNVYKKSRIVHTIHDVCPHRGEESLFKKFVNFYFRKHSQSFIVHGNYLKKILLKSSPWINQDNVFTIPIGPLSVFSKQNSNVYSELNNTILFFGRLSKYKGLEYLIRAEPIISQYINNFRIVIAGFGESIKKYEKIMINKRRFIILNRYISHTEIPKLFQESSIVVLPYIEASQSGVIPLAYEYKKPVIATSVGSIPEVVDDGITGYVVEPKNYQQLAEKIVYLLKNSCVKEKMGENGYKKIQQEMNWKKIAENTYQVYLSNVND